MTVELPQAFNDFARGLMSPEAFEHEILTLCRTTPERAWEALALLDQHFRRRKIAAQLHHSLRHRIERQALGLERYQPERPPSPPIATAPAIPAAPDAGAENPTIENVVAPQPPMAARARWRPYFGISPAIALTTVMLAVAASPTVEKGHENALAMGAGARDGGAGAASRSGGAATSARASEQGPHMLSLSSDRYVINPGSGVAEIAVERSPDADGDTSFLWWTEGSGAKPGEDYVAGRPRRAQMAAGVGSSTLRIPILANPKRRHIEMFYVVIGRPEGNVGVGPVHRAAVFLLPQPAR